MKKLIVLLACLFIVGNVSAFDCFTQQVGECHKEHLMHIDAIIGFFSNNSMYLENYRVNSSRYINDLGHEFPVESYIMGTYWSGGAYGSKDGYSNYYGNVHWTYYPSYYGYYSHSMVPEPATVLFLVGGSLVLMRRRRNGKTI